MTGWQIQRIEVAQLQAAAAALTDAFLEDPLLSVLAPDEDVRERLAELVFPLQLRLALPAHHSYLARSEAGTVGGVICVFPPGAYPPSYGVLLRHLPAQLIKVGPILPSLLRAFPGMRYIGATRRLHLKERHWYVMVLGVARELHGHGLGRLLLEHAIALAEDARLPLYLETTTPRNVGFYEHLGFAVSGRETPSRRGPPIWGLLRRNR